MAVSNLLRQALDWLYPPKCALCGILERPAICPECLSEMTRPEERVTLLMPGTGLDCSLSLFLYDGRASQAVRRLKYERITSLAPVMSALMAAELERSAVPHWDIIVPVPIHWTRSFHRGFNQSELLCQCFAMELVRPELLKRVRRTRSQVGLPRHLRMRNLEGAFSAPPEVKGLRVMLLDDVTTSGGTGDECARTLKRAGARWVGLYTFCTESARHTASKDGLPLVSG